MPVDSEKISGSMFLSIDQRLHEDSSHPPSMTNSSYIVQRSYSKLTGGEKDMVSHRYASLLIALALLGSIAIVWPDSTASGSVSGSFPDRVFQLTKSQKDNTYSTEFVPSFDGEWWVELTSIGRGSVTIVVNEGNIAGGHHVLSSTDLSVVGSESKHGFIYAGSIYILSFTLKGSPGTAVLQEHFVRDIQPSPEPPPFETSPHAPIAIMSDADFLNPINGVSGGSGTSEDPFVIEGWEISVSTEIGIKLWYTSSSVVIRDCFVHLIGYPAHGIYLFFAANVVIENCYVEDCVGSEIAVGSSHNIVLSNNVIWGQVYIYNSYSCELLRNKIREAGLDIQCSNDILIEGNTFSDSPWMAIWFVDNAGLVVVHNNFVNNDQNVWLYGLNTVVWDLGYPEGGNYWSDYQGQDSNADGIGDTPYVIDSSNQDRFPLVIQI